MPTSEIWKKIRVRYCILKAMISGPKSLDELLDQISSFPEFRPVRRLKWESDELIAGIKTNIQELKGETKIKERDIFNTRTKERRIEWFINQAWLNQTRLFKVEINRVRKLEEAALKAKVEQERFQQLKEEREKTALREKIDREMRAKLSQEQVISPKTKEIGDKSDSNSVLNGILSVVAVGGGLYVIGKIGDSLSKALTFPVFLISCAVAFSIYQLSKNKAK